MVMIVVYTALLALGLVSTLAQDASPENLLAFASYNDGDADIYVLDLNTTSLIQLTFNDKDDLAPSWSPDGEQIVFGSNQDGDWEIYIMDRDGSNLVNLTDNDDEDLYPAWSPDGEHIAFTSNHDGAWNIYLIRPQGDELIQLTFEAIYQGNPTWSPDGEHIAYVADRESRREIRILNPWTAEEQALTSNSFADYSPAWSPDGEQIAFISTRSGNTEVYTVSVDCIDIGTCEDDLVNVTNYRDNDYDPSWSPDGSQIIFGSARTNVSIDLYAVDAAGGEPVQLTDNQADDRFPAWWSDAED
jgi:TolB protein